MVRRQPDPALRCLADSLYRPESRMASLYGGVGGQRRSGRDDPDGKFDDIPLREDSVCDERQPEGIEKAVSRQTDRSAVRQPADSLLPALLSRRVDRTARESAIFRNGAEFQTLEIRR